MYTSVRNVKYVLLNQVDHGSFVPGACALLVSSDPRLEPLRTDLKNHGSGLINWSACVQVQ